MPPFLGALLCAAGLFVSPGKIFSQVPQGVFSITDNGIQPLSSVLANADVDGITLRQDWSALEPTEGNFDWTYLDSAVAASAGAGKQVLLRISTQAAKPAWVTTAVRNAGGSFFTFTNNGVETKIPVFWDPTFLAKKTAMIAALGAHFRNNPAVKIVSASFANATTEDWYVPDTRPLVTQWLALGYTSQKMLDAGRTIIDATMAAFPNQYVTLAVGGNLHWGLGYDLDPTADYVARNAVLNARASWPGKLIVQKNDLSTFIPVFPGTGTFYQMISDFRPDVAGQMFYWCFGDSTYRVNNGVPIDPAVALTESVDNGVSYGEKYIEIFQTDVANLPTVISYAHHALNGTTPTPTPSPTPTPTPVQTKPWPAGIIGLCAPDTIENPIGDLSGMPAWTNPRVDGIRLRCCWNVVQPQSGAYNWSTIDQALSLANQHGKKIGVSISAGTLTPQWVYDSGATKYILANRSAGAMPLPWEAAFQNKWLAFINEFGARYDGNPALAYVCPTGFMQNCVMYFAPDPRDESRLTALATQAGYASLSDAYVPAAESIIASFAAAFPTTAIVLNPVVPFTTGGQGAVDSIRNWGFDTYPGQFGVMYPLQATIPPHTPPPPALPYPKGNQMLCVASDAARLYEDPDPIPLPLPPIPLQDALENAVSLDGQYVEIYGSDLTPPLNQTVLAIEGAKLKANLPP
jgi:Beta-galactosidase